MTLTSLTALVQAQNGRFLACEVLLSLLLPWASGGSHYCLQAQPKSSLTWRRRSLVERA